MRLAGFLACATLATACTTILPHTPEEVPAEVEGARAVYLDSAAARAIGPAPLPEGHRDFLTDRLRGGLGPVAVPTVSAGRLVVDTLYGLYVLPLADTSATFDSARYVRIWGIAAIGVAGVDEVEVSNFEDAVTLRFAGADSVAVVTREPGRYPYPAINRRFDLGVRGGRGPRFGFGEYFECYDPTRGFFGGWEAATLTRPQCLGQTRW